MILEDIKKIYYSNIKNKVKLFLNNKEPSQKK